MDDRLSLSVTHSDGRITRWGGSEPNAQDIPADLTFSTSIPGGFKDLSCSLLRRIDLDYSDQGLFDSVRVYGPGNRTAFEGRMVQFPRSHGDGFQIVPGAVGHSAMLTDDPSFMEVYVDRDLGHWGSGSVQYRLNYVGAYTAADPSVVPDDATGFPSLKTGWTGAWTATSKGLSAAWYKAAPVAIGSLYYAWKKNANVANGDANWSWLAYLSTDDVATTINATANLRAAGPGTGTLSTSGAAKKYIALEHSYAAGPAGADNTDYDIFWTVLAVYGTHGLTKQGSAGATSAQGFYASDVIQDIVTRTAPLLNIAEIEATTFVIPHLVFDSPTNGESAIQFVNAYEGKDWGVYDDMGFFFRASDPDRLCWKARLSEGARLDLEGETAEQIFNGVYVTYTDPSGQKKTVGPTGATADATDAQLLDSSAINPVNATYGTSYKRWGLLEISQITTLAGATQLGAIWLLSHAAPQRRGTLTLTGTATHPTEGDVPVWRVRAGDYVSISDHPADVPRKIIETRYTHGARQITLNLDNTPYVLDALLTRFGASLVGVL